VDVGLPIASVIPSLDGPVLAALASTTAPLTLSRVHRLGGRGSVGGVRLVLLRLVRAGIVLEVPGGYVLNREHIAAPAIESLAGLHGELVDRIRAAVDAWGGDVSLVGLFGSAARRDGDEESDIDVLVISNEANARELAIDLASSIRRWTGNDAQVVAIPEAELRRLRRAGEPIVENWRKDLVVICGDRAVLERGA
jgi:predicted nucleotidyltransferase